MASKKYPEAIISYRNAVSLDERFGEARLKLAEAYLAAGDTQNGLREVRARSRPVARECRRPVASWIDPPGWRSNIQRRGLAPWRPLPRNHGITGALLLGNALAGLKDLDAAVEQVESAHRFEAPATHAQLR